MDAPSPPRIIRIPSFSTSAPPTISLKIPPMPARPRRDPTPRPGAPPMANALFRKKPLDLLLREMHGENRLRRILGPAQLTALGVGAIIGTGIFILTGIAARDRTGPSLMLSFVVSG